MDLKAKAGELVTELRTHWNEPHEGKKLTYKEIAAYSVGGMGITASAVLCSQIAIGGGLFCLEVLHLNQDQIAILAFISTIVGLVRAPLVAWLVDNMNSKMGKFRPWILWMTLPMLLIIVAVAWTPVTMSATGIFVYTMITSNLLLTFQQLYSTGYGGLPSVMTSDAGERASMLSIGSFLYSLGPSIINALFPVFVGLIYKSTGGYVWAFRIVVPIFALITAGVGLLSLKTKERIIQPREHKRKVPFWWGVKQVFKNGPLWLNTISGLVAVFKGNITGICGFIAIYQLDSYEMQGLFATIIGTASVPGMLLAPLLIKKIGKRNLVILTNFMYLGIISMFFIFGFESVPLSIVIIYLALLTQGVQVVTGGAIGADINDYQQYISGERMEGFMGMITGYLGTAVTAVTPFITAAMNKSIGFNVAEDLRTHSILMGSFKINLYLSVASCLLCTIPFFFYKLTEKRHAEIIVALEERANAADIERGFEASYEIDPELAKEAKEDLGVSEEDMAVTPPKK